MWPFCRVCARVGLRLRAIRRSAEFLFATWQMGEQGRNDAMQEAFDRAELAALLQDVGLDF
jgi:hypothetical protein